MSFWIEPQLSATQISEAILKLSDFYIANPQGFTPWDEEFCQLAYRHYYLPLNALRCQQVIARGQQVGFFEGLHHFIDWGCGPGTASLALVANESLRPQIQSQTLFDHSMNVLRKFEDLHHHLVQLKKTDQLKLKSLGHTQDSLLIFSYSITELDQLPEGWNQFEALMILEPSTRDDGRKLLERRELLIQNGYSIWAPCTHHLKCPLLNQSKHDWCHDRAHVEAPEWFTGLENHLPMKNRTVTTSYLLARRKKPPEHLKNLARLTGDSLDEKGKTRQLMCRNENREFLSWMHKSITPQVLNRGDLIEIPQDYEVKANELRLKQTVQVVD